MKPELAKRLCCPKCQEGLEAHAFVGIEESGGVQEGVLLCARCRLRFPVTNGVPVLLLFRTALHDSFERRFHEDLERFSSFNTPAEAPGPGEQTIQETFTEEWDPIAAEKDELSFLYTEEDLIALNRDVWLKWLKSTPREVSSALVVGCGGGLEAIALSRLIPTAEVIAVDISLAVLHLGPALARQPRMHLVVCSLFSLPFRKESFDLVYSQGVIMANPSTRAAFGSIARFARVGGHLFVWVYGLDDHLVRKGLAGVVTRVNRLVEELLRPILSRCPRILREVCFLVMGLVVHPLVLTRVRHRRIWRLKNTIHGLRDRFSPRYAHRHSYNEVIEWYEREGFEIVDVQSPAAYWDLFQKRLWGVGMTGRRITKSD